MAGPYNIPTGMQEGDPGQLDWADRVANAINDMNLRLNALEGEIPYEGPFDNFEPPYRAHSLRRLLTDYTGPLVRVRRSSDNVEADIPYLADGSLDTGAVLAHVGAGSGYVVTWYDQSGHGRHVTQATAASQPRIANAGVLDTSNGKAAMLFDGVDDYLLNALGGLATAAAATLAFVMQSVVNNLANAVTITETTAGLGGGFWRPVRGSNANWNVQAANQAGTSLWAATASGSNLFDMAQHQGFYAEAAGVINTWRDSVAAHVNTTATRTGTFNPNQFVLGAQVGNTVGNYYNGMMQEVVAWADDLTTDRLAIQAAQRSFWGTP